MYLFIVWQEESTENVEFELWLVGVAIFELDVLYFFVNVVVNE